MFTVQCYLVVLLKSIFVKLPNTAVKHDLDCLIPTILHNQYNEHVFFNLKLIIEFVTEDDVNKIKRNVCF